MDDLALTGPSLRVRIPREEDAAALFAAASDPEVTRWFSWGPYTSQDEARAYLARLPAQRARGEHFDLVVEHLQAGPIGISGLGEPVMRDRHAVIGSWLGRAWWGTGANRECKALMCHLAFAVLGFDRVGAYANVEHARSQRALERIGFEREGVLRGYHRHGDRTLDVVVFGLLRAQWEAGPLPAVPVTVAGEPPPAFVVT
ncbi:MAG: GNAT family protein [Solirubrobacteraceae bacterium]|nr:GNAT family protein [Solirubrobacteraceae bacterium]